eukprot:75710-Pelagomonas_calceolata.AAC.1
MVKLGGQFVDLQASCGYLEVQGHWKRGSQGWGCLGVQPKVYTRLPRKKFPPSWLSPAFSCVAANLDPTSSAHSSSLLSQGASICQIAIMCPCWHSYTCPGWCQPVGLRAFVYDAIICAGIALCVPRQGRFVELQACVLSVDIVCVFRLV